MPYVKTYRIFITHAWFASEDYNRLIKLLESIQNFKIEVCSVTGYDPFIDPESMTGYDKLKSIMDYQIRPVNVAFILPSLFASHESWVKLAIYLFEMNGIFPLVMAPADGKELPGFLSIKAKAVIDWNLEVIEENIKAFSTTRFGAT